MSGRLSTLAAALVVWVLGTPVSAHELPGSSARVSLRDGLLTVSADLDLKTWLAQLGGGDLEVLLGTARRQSEDGLAVTIDGTDVPMSLVAFPVAAEVHEALQHAAQQAAHPALARVRWEAREVTPAARVVDVRFPEQAGPVVVTFVQPVTRWTAPGASVRFEVRGADSAEGAGPPWWMHLVALAAAVVVAGLLVRAGRRRRPERSGSEEPRR